MIRFFRTIRQHLLVQGRVARYLTYALGEIVLVVIGILVALQLNNRNHKEQIRELEIKYLKEIAANLRSDSIDIAFNIEFNEVRLRSGQMVLKALNENGAYSDTLDQYFGNLIYTTRSVVNFSAYETLKSRGLEIITNDSLRKAITHLYSFSYHNAIDFEKQDDHAMQYEVVIPSVVNKIIFHPREDVRMAMRSAEPRDFEALKKDDDFKNALMLNTELRGYMLDIYRGLAGSVASCRAHIKSELETLED